MMKYPIGIQNFEKLRSEVCAYVGKTPRQLLIFMVLIALFFPLDLWAKLNLGDVFTADGIDYKVISLDPMQVQFGARDDNNPVVDKSITGSFNIPSTVIGSDGNSYSVKTISHYAFYGCTGLSSVSIPNSVTTISSAAFEGCSGLTSITIPDGVVSIYNHAFAGCNSLTSVNIPNSVTYLGRYAFYGCSSLISVILPDNMISIEMGTFFDCSSLTSVTIPITVTSIGDNAFTDCSSLSTVTIPEGVTSIGNQAFLNCSSLTSFTFPSKVTSIGETTFYGCNGFTSMDIPYGITTIGEGAFFNCEGLVSVTIPSSVTSIDRFAFAYCTKLTSVTVNIQEPIAIDDEAFLATTDATLYVPKESVEAYKADDHWKGFKEILPISTNDAGTAKAKVMVVTTMDGKKTKLGLKNEPNITIETPYLVYKSNVAEAKFELDQLRDIKYEDVKPIPGDASGDGVINKADVDETILYILGTPSDDFNFNNADVNNDQVINIADVIHIINTINNLEKNERLQSRNTADSQQHQYAIYNYRNDNDFNAFLNVDIDKIIYSNIGLDGTEYKNAVVQEVWTPDSVYRIPIQAIDSIGFRAPEPVVKDGVFHITEDHCPYVIDTDDLSITFNPSIPSSMLPEIGQVIISDIYGEVPFESGFAGRVKKIINESNLVKIECDVVTLDDIYDQIICIGRTITYSSDDAKTRGWLSINKDGTLEVELLPIKIKLKDPDVESSDMSIGLDITPSMSLDYTIVYNVKGMDNHFKIVAKPQLDFDIDFKYKSKIFGDKILKMADSFIPIETTIPGLYAKLKWGGFFDYEGNLSVDGKLSYKAVMNVGYDSAKEDYYGFIFNNDGSGWEEPDVSVSLNGYIFYGPAFQLVACLVSEKWLPSFTITAKPGCKLSGKFEINDDMFTGESVSVYDALKNSKISCSGELSIEGEANVFSEKFTLPSTEWKPEWLKQDFYLFPNFTEASLLDMSEINGTDYSASSLYSEVSRDLFLPCKIGMAVYDLEGRKVREQFNEEKYWFEKDWSKPLPVDRVNRVGVNMGGLPSNNIYKVCPVVKSIMPMFEVEQASPTTFFQIPLSLELEQNNLSLGIGQIKEIPVYRGWGDYQIINGDVKVAKASFFPDSFTPGGGAGGGGGTSWPNDSFAGNGAGGGGGSSWFNGDSSSSSTENEPQIYIEGIGVGKTTIQVKDMRSNETASILVVVTDEETPSLQLSSTLFTLEVGKKGTVTVSSGSGKYTAESSKSDVATVKVSDGKIQVTAIKAGSTTITVTDMETNQTAIIEVSVTEAEPEAPYIPVQTETIVVKGVPFTMVAVEGGSFMMGSPDDDSDANRDEKPQHRVVLSNFAIGQTEVTQALWEVVMGDNPSYNKGYKYPVESVTRDMCNSFISKLNTLTGRTFRLPTEAEWEYAARGGKNSQGYKYAGSDDIDVVSWYDENSDGVTHPVAQKKANELGLYDMSGNVWELCQDYYNKNYYRFCPVVNPCNTTESYAFTMRSGGPANVSYFNRVAFRADQVLLEDQSAVESNWDIGLRLVLSDGKTGYKETPAEDESYIVYEDGKLTFYCDSHKNIRSGEIFSIPDGKPTFWPSEIRNNVETVVFDSSFAKSRPTTTRYWFSEFKILSSIEGIEYLNTSSVSSMEGMFFSCLKLTTLDLSSFNTSKVTNMYYMFNVCENIKSLDVSSFNTANVTNMHFMFGDCKSLESLDVSHFNTANVTDMRGMFGDCKSLKSLDVSNFNTVNVTDMGWMFGGCENIKSLDVSNFNTANVTDMGSMFGGCTNLEFLDVSNFNTANVTDMGGMFAYCGRFQSLDLSNFDTSKVTDMSDMFLCSQLTSIDVSNFNTANVTNMKQMFSHCHIKSLDLSNFATSKVTDMDGMFWNSDELKTLNISSFDVSNDINMYCMFLGCSKLETIYCGNDAWDMEKVSDHRTMFDGCLNLVGGKGTKYDSNHIDGEYARIDGGPNSPGYFTSVNAVTIKVEPQDIDFGTMTKGSSKTDYFIIYNTGKDNLIFHLDYSTLDGVFNVLEGGEETVLKPGESKKYTVTCTIPKDYEYYGGGVAIYVRSNASNDESVMVGVGVNVIHEEN